MSQPDDALRLDKWLFFARLFKSRGLAAERIEGGGVRLNGMPCRKPGRMVRPGDVVVVSAYGQLRCVRVLSLPQRRGPASEAQHSYEIVQTDQADGRD
ncbi:RNA-binding S4 domain-containing protein [Paracoccus sp. Z330]|uniref:RNA-binding S4 domain-containing protein n=1 Tax=Paracoccus onchidii TaxID=3017813 RepID=A0ABT4ZCE0_9RHOB|nr:RNA-binding S4 domain-containing protein [Paracoccus onchidii]MDB6176930.1 RNA-binding S4 domain-containing protein [Paracoccus onchidii]